MKNPSNKAIIRRYLEEVENAGDVSRIMKSKNIEHGGAGRREQDVRCVRPVNGDL